MTEPTDTVARRLGVILVPSARVMAILHDGAVRGVRLAGGREIAAKAAVLAVDPWTARSLIEDSDLDRQVKAMIPVDLACLDLALTRLPRPKSHFALGIDEPLYFSVHSAVADLAPAGAATVHIAKYLERAAPGSTDLNELEGFLDRVQPGWRELVVWRRFLPSMRAANALVTASGGSGGCISRGVGWDQKACSPMPPSEVLHKLPR